MLVIGLVGGIGSGKSTVATMLGELGAEVIHADAIGHEIYRPGTPGFAAVVAAFGREVVGGNGEIDRKRLGARVFEDPAALARLNAIAHPLIRAEIGRRIDTLRESGRRDPVVVEAAILLEAGWRGLVDRVWVVKAGREHVVERLEAQRGLSADEVETRMARQMTDAERDPQADEIIENHGSVEELRTRVSQLWHGAIAR